LPLGRLAGHGDHPHLRNGKGLAGAVVAGILAPGGGEEQAQGKHGKKIFVQHGFDFLFQGLFDGS
jgi:hypothetical protein